ncbi:MAG: DNA internalization-related competence protein ComEC/Rec2 [bacterium]
MPRTVRRLPTPIYWIASGLLIGQLLATAWPGWLPRLLASVLLGAVLAGWRRRAAPLALAVAAAALGHRQVDAQQHAPPAVDDVQQLAGARAWVHGSIVERPARRPGALRLVLELSAVRQGPEWRPASGRVLVTVSEAAQTWQRGDGVETLLSLRRPRNFGNPGEFDYEAYLARRGVRVTAFATADRGWTRWPCGIDSWRVRLDAWRDATARTLAASLDPPTAALAAALLIGEGGALDDDVRSRYARAGVSHVLSISGLHIGLVAAAAFAAARWLLGRSERLLLSGVVPKLAITASLAPVLLYAAIAGDNVATQRAEVMGVLVAAAMLLDRPRDWLAPLAAAAVALSLATPGAVNEISFQLSFLAVLGLVLGMPRLTAAWEAWAEAHLLRLRDRRWRWVRWIVVSQAATLCAVLATTPLAAWHFNQISLVAPLANPLVVPLLGMVTVGLGLIGTLAVAVVPAAAPPLFAAAGVAVRLADHLTTWLAALPAASVRVVTPSLLELALMYAAMAACLLPAGRWRQRALVACALALAIDAATWTVVRQAPGALRVTFVSVGQGDCALVEFPGGHVLVIDGGGLGGHFDVGARVVAPLLWRRKIAQVDWLALSHADFDHFGGLPFLVETFAPRALWWNGTPGHGARFAALRRAIDEQHVALLAPAPGAEWNVDGVDVRVLYPPPHGEARDNDRSLVLQLRYGGRAVLFTGDLEAAGEAALVQRWGATLASDVLKVPHHGSRTSSSPALLQAVAPRLAVISAGADNRFGFPHPTVEAAYERIGARIWRTDRDGAVTIHIAAGGALTATSTRDTQMRAASRSVGLDSAKRQSLQRGVSDSDDARASAP